MPRAPGLIIRQEAVGDWLLVGRRVASSLTRVMCCGCRVPPELLSSLRSRKTCASCSFLIAHPPSWSLDNSAAMRRASGSVSAGRSRLRGMVGHVPVEGPTVPRLVAPGSGSTLLGHLLVFPVLNSGIFSVRFFMSLSVWLAAALNRTRATRPLRATASNASNRAQLFKKRIHFPSALGSLSAFAL